MNIYLDDNLADVQLLKLLVRRGHLAIQPADVGMKGQSDAKHFEYTIRHLRIILTGDKGDFEDLHKLVLTAGGSHPGILIVRFEKDSTKNMRPKHIAAAITKLAKAGVSCTDSLIVLNQWR